MGRFATRQNTVDNLFRAGVFVDLYRVVRQGVRVGVESYSIKTNDSPKEAAEVARLVVQLLDGGQWTNQRGERAPIGALDVMVVTPYNAQIRQIERALEGVEHADVRVGTVDKFQGQEAPVVIYSMATSSAEDAPRGMEFLYDLHRLNVATSRARAIAIIVASPQLVGATCRTPGNMRLANSLCRVWELGSA